MKRIIPLALLAVAAVPAAAQESLGAHVHGHATIDMALNADGQLIAEFESPKANILGFEYDARTPEEEAAEEEAEAFLLDGASVFAFTPAAGCSFVTATLHEEHHEHHEDEEHESEEHEHEAHEDHDDEHEDHEEGETHADIGVSYEFTCTAPARLNWVDVQLFDRFGGFEDIDFVYLDDRTQVARELSPSDTRAEW